tara:strand:+ start:166 stop:1293 length:1128 start_codon:yes stop_codon:yes gene_type:complete
MIKILVTGDFCPINRNESLIDNCDFSNLFNDFLPLISKSDLSITNLECPLIDKGDKIKKTGPNLKAKTNAIKALVYADFNLVTLANNHIMDYGSKGLKSTIQTCKKHSIDTVGAGENHSQAKKTFYKIIDNLKIAVINFCENEWSTTQNELPGTNPLNPISNHNQIKEAKLNADYVFVIVHGGHEHYQLPSPRMTETYRFFIDSGADSVIGHHTHCVSGYEIYNNKPIFYSLGNFVFDWPKKRKSLWNKGYAVQFTIDKEEINFTLYPYTQGGEGHNFGVKLMKGSSKKNFMSELALLNDQISKPELIEEEFNKYVYEHKQQYYSHLEPYTNRYLVALYNRKLLPSFICKAKKRLLLNVIRCEAHKDVLIKILNK